MHHTLEGKKIKVTHGHNYSSAYVLDKDVYRRVCEGAG